MPVQNTLTIGRLARAAGVHVETIRYYQRIGLIEQPPRPPRGYRHYPAATVDRLRFIRRAQALGLRLDAIRELLALDQGDCRHAQQIAGRQLAAIRRRIRDLEVMAAALDRLITSCHEDREHNCPLIRSLMDSRHGD